MPKYDYGVLTYYPTNEAWVINFSASNPELSLERKVATVAEGVRALIFEVIDFLGGQGWVMFQVDGYTERDYPVYHLRRVRS